MISINAPPGEEFADAAGGAASVATTTGATTAGPASVGARAGAGACATFAAVGGSGTLVATSGELKTGGTAVSTGVRTCESVVLNARAGVAVNTAGLDEPLAEIGRGVIVAPVATRGATPIPLWDSSVGSTTSVSGCVVGVAVGVGVRVGVAVNVGVRVRVGVDVLVARTPAIAGIGPW